MSPIRTIALVLTVLGTCAGSVRAAECEATPVCWWHCRPRVTCYQTPCGPKVCYYEPPCGPIRRLLGLCRPVPIVTCAPVCAVPAPPPCASCGGTAPPVIVQPAPAAVPAPAVPVPSAAPPELPRYSPPPATGSSYQPQRLPVQPPTPVRLDRMVSNPGEH